MASGGGGSRPLGFSAAEITGASCRRTVYLGVLILLWTHAGCYAVAESYMVQNVSCILAS